MKDIKIQEFIDNLSSKAPVPGGGGVSALVGALGAALGMMVTNLTIGKKKYAAVEEEIVEIREKLLQMQRELLGLIEEDAKAFEPLAKAYGLKAETDEEKESKQNIMEKALLMASEPPIQMMRTITSSMELLASLGEKGSIIAISDVGVGILFALAALEGASLNVFINTKSMKNREMAEVLNEEANTLICRGREIKDKTYETVLQKLK